MEATIQASDLRIGDYVFVGNKIRKIYNLYSDGLDFLHSDIECRFVDYQFTKPIPLTEDIYDKYSKEFYSLVNGYAHSKSSNIMMIYIADLSIEIKYLHQLQNLYFALTNTELEIQL